MSTITQQTTRPPAARQGRRLLDYSDLWDRGIRFSKVHLWRLSKAGKFPAPIKLGALRMAWDEREIDAWLDARAAEREGSSDDR